MASTKDLAILSGLISGAGQLAQPFIAREQAKRNLQQQLEAAKLKSLLAQQVEQQKVRQALALEQFKASQPLQVPAGSRLATPQGKVLLDAIMKSAPGASIYTGGGFQQAPARQSLLVQPGTSVYTGGKFQQAPARQPKFSEIVSGFEGVMGAQPSARLKSAQAEKAEQEAQRIAGLLPSEIEEKEATTRLKEARAQSQLGTASKNIAQAMRLMKTAPEEANKLIAETQNILQKTETEAALLPARRAKIETETGLTKERIIDTRERRPAEIRRIDTDILDSLSKIKEREAVLPFKVKKAAEEVAEFTGKAAKRRAETEKILLGNAEKRLTNDVLSKTGFKDKSEAIRAGIEIYKAYTGEREFALKAEKQKMSIAIDWMSFLQKKSEEEGRLKLDKEKAANEFLRFRKKEELEREKLAINLQNTSNERMFELAKTLAEEGRTSEGKKINAGLAFMAIKEFSKTGEIPEAFQDITIGKPDITIGKPGITIGKPDKAATSNKDIIKETNNILKNFAKKLPDGTARPITGKEARDAAVGAFNGEPLPEDFVTKDTIKPDKAATSNKDIIKETNNILKNFAKKLPDGTVRPITGKEARDAAVGAFNGEPPPEDFVTKDTIKDVRVRSQRTVDFINDSKIQLADLNAIIGGYGSTIQNMVGYGNNAVNYIREKLQFDDPEFVRFKTATQTFYNKYLKSASGSQVTRWEELRFKKALPNTGDSPQAYMAKAKELRKIIKRHLKIKLNTLQEFSLQPTGIMTNVDALLRDEVPGIIEQGTIGALGIVDSQTLQEGAALEE